ncbi:thioredoxin-like protein [Sphaerosporella brunnea]|uniref:thioredoxin-dependent peroxiredoxin n=1 Tax=Sphaerosporella brunnea TaxID=1250544 RepID=A0A5J5EEV0_9PEZI|nr:thioredoxin-like protein [Sphaerosporella brunnea]
MSAPPVVLRRSTRNAAKRESPAVDPKETAAPAPKKKRTTTTAIEKKPAAEKKAAAPKKATAPKKTAAAPAVVGATSSDGATSSVLKEGDELPEDLPEIQTHAGETTTLSALVKAAEKGIVIFAYPKASTPGCTTQACAFRDSTASFNDAGYAIYGLSGDSPSANEKFKTKQNLADITLLCDPKYELHARLNVKKEPKGTVRSIVVISKSDDKAVILKKSPASPAQSVEMAQKAIGISEAKAPEVKAD